MRDVVLPWCAGAVCGVREELLAALGLRASRPGRGLEPPSASRVAPHALRRPRARSGRIGHKGFARAACAPVVPGTGAGRENFFGWRHTRVTRRARCVNAVVRMVDAPGPQGRGQPEQGVHGGKCKCEVCALAMVSARAVCRPAAVTTRRAGRMNGWGLDRRQTAGADTGTQAGRDASTRRVGGASRGEGGPARGLWQEVRAQ